MSIGNIIIIFIVFCVTWIVTNAVNEVLVSKMRQQSQKQRIDAAYAQISRLVIRSIAEYAGKERAKHDKM